MAEIRNYGLLRHFRSEANFHVARHRGGKLRQTGRGLAFWFRPEGASIAEVPLDDREQALLFHAQLFLQAFGELMVGLTPCGKTDGLNVRPHELRDHFVEVSRIGMAKNPSTNGGIRHQGSSIG